MNEENSNENEEHTDQVNSKDGTKISYDKVGRGPTIILVAGALGTRFSWSELPKLLAPQFTVISYDRRGRGDSTDITPYSPEREIEDVEALIDRAVGGSAYLYGISSGGALALRAVAKLGPRKVSKLAIYEAPFSTDVDDSKRATEYHTKLTKLLSAGDEGEAVALFMKYVGVPDEQIQGMQHAPMWKDFEALASTLEYDSLVLGEGFRLPKERAAQIAVPTLVMVGGASPEFMVAAAQELKSSILGAQLCTLNDQTHNVEPEALAPALIEFFSGT